MEQEIDNETYDNETVMKKIFNLDKIFLCTVLEFTLNWKTSVFGSYLVNGYICFDKGGNLPLGKCLY